MATNQEPISRSILPSTQQVTSGTGFTQLAEATTQVGKLLTDKATDVLAERAAIQGAQDVEEGNQPEKLALPITKVTKSYNDAVARTEANRMVMSAQNLINEALVNSTNPATFTRETPAQFNATLEGIVSGTLQNTRDENRAYISSKLNEMSANASIKMLQHSIDFDNKQTEFDMKKDISGLLEARRSASIAGELDRVEGIDAALESTVKDYSEMNAEIARIAPYLRQEIEENKIIDNVLNEYTHASTRGEQAQFLNEFAKNKDNIPFNTWQKAAEAMIGLQTTEQKLSHEVNAQQFQQAKGAIDNQTLNDVDDLLNLPDLTVTQQIQLMNHLETRDRQQFKSQEKILQAQNHIIRNQSAMISSDIANSMFQDAQKRFEQATGRPMTLTDMVESATGKSAVPVSGLPGTPLGRDVPAINAQMKNQLTSNNPVLIREAAEVFNNVVNVDNNDNAINIDGRALDVASLFNTLNQGQEDPNALAIEVRNTVMNLSEKDYNTRVDYFNRHFNTSPRTGKSELDIKFKNITGVNPQLFKTDAAMNFFKAEYRLSYLNSNSEEAADASVKYKMRSWGTSKYFDDGVVSQPVPEKELNITQIGNTFDNQYRMTIQDIINENEQQRTQQGLNVPKIEWQEPSEQHIDLQNLTDEQKVFGKLGISKQREKLASVGQYARPQIKVDGRPTEVFLVPSPESRLGERVQYALFYKDKFGNQQPIADISSPTGVAMFSPDSLQNFAPRIFEEKFQDQLKQAAMKIQRAQAKQELNQITDIGLLDNLPFAGSLMSTSKLLKDPDRSKEIFRKLFSEDSFELEQILRQKIQGDRRADKADNVGIKADTGQRE